MTGRPRTHSPIKCWTDARRFSAQREFFLSDIRADARDQKLSPLRSGSRIIKFFCIDILDLKAWTSMTEGVSANFMQENFGQIFRSPIYSFKRLAGWMCVVSVTIRHLSGRKTGLPPCVCRRRAGKKPTTLSR